MEGAILGIRSIAVSQAYNWDVRVGTRLRVGGDLCAGSVQEADRISNCRPTALLNVNFPACAADEVKGVKVTVQGHHEQSGLSIDERQDGRGYPYYWLRFPRPGQIRI